MTFADGAWANVAWPNMAWLVIGMPLLGAAAAALAGHRARDLWAQLFGCLGAFGALVASIYLFDGAMAGGQEVAHGASFVWFASGALSVSWGVRVDLLSASMFLVVSAVSFLVHVYAVGYMKGDKSVPRFMAYLGLFTFFMLSLAGADNLLQLFFGWEGVGLCSYLLIGFWIEKPSAVAAGMKAFLVNRLADFAFLCGLFICFGQFGTFDFDALFAKASGGAFSLVAALLFIGAMGKSAQVGLHVWLPDAMEGPTPVSALIHAATMVTAGVFLLARLMPLYASCQEVLAFVAVVGAVTALMAGVLAILQYDIKRVIAYSTMSQLGYMFMALGMGAAGAAMFHLATHAFFKALLFLGAGAVIHAAQGEQDLRKLGGLWRKMPWTYLSMWIGVLALTGVGVEGFFGFAGFYSKDAILAAAREEGGVLGFGVYGAGLLGAFLTALYAGRLIVLTFHGKEKAGATEEEVHGAHGEQGGEAPMLMRLPMLILALPSLGLGWAVMHFADFAGHLEGFEAWMPSGLALLGLALGLFFFGETGTRLCKRLAERKALKHSEAKGALGEGGAVSLSGAQGGVWNGLGMSGQGAVGEGGVSGSALKPLRPSWGVLCLRTGRAGFYFDAFYDRFIVKDGIAFARGVRQIVEDELIDRFGVDGFASGVRALGARVASVQNGFLPHYAGASVFGVFAFLTWFWMRG